jgi:4-amino-4-deoxy-L-arabinose transferase-like glycosyltransferase
VTSHIFPTVRQQRDSSNPFRRLTDIGAPINGVAFWCFLLISSVAFIVRSVGLSRSFELWVDEMIYAALSNSVSQGHLPTIADGLFFLHPPGAFIINGLVIKAFGLSGDPMSLVYNLRWVNAVLGALTVGIAFLIVRRVASAGVAWACAILMALDPFVLRNNSRVFLETPATIFILGGYLLLLNNLCSERKRLSAWILILSGLLFGYGIFTKDVFILMTIVPIILAGFWRATLPWRAVGIICSAAAIPYASYLLLLVADRVVGQWVTQKESGIERMIGLQQSTGFNAPNAPSLTSRLVDQISQYGTSYILLLLCPIVAVIAIRSRYPSRRLIGMCVMSMGAFGIYTALFGTFEEQYGYGVMVASILGIGVAYAELRERRPGRMLVIRTFGVILVVLTATLGIRAELTTDNGFQQAKAWIALYLPANVNVSVTNPTGQWAFVDDPHFGEWLTAASMRQHNANYILTQSLPTIEGYGDVKPAMLEWLEKNAIEVFHMYGPTNGNTVLWYVKPSLLQQAANAGIGS